MVVALEEVVRYRKLVVSSRLAERETEPEFMIASKALLKGIFQESMRPQISRLTDLDHIRNDWNAVCSTDRRIREEGLRLACFVRNGLQKARTTFPASFKMSREYLRSNFRAGTVLRE